MRMLRASVLKAGIAMGMAATLVGCGASAVPDPNAAARAYADAARRGDGAALYEMLSARAQAEHSRADVDRLVKEQREELRARGAELDRVKDIHGRASLKFADGEQVTLDLVHGRYLISSAGDLPGGAASPHEALHQLRRVLARRSYAGLLQVLSPATRRAIENDLRSLVSGLEHAETLDVRTVGDTASVQVPGGHMVKLRREGSTWHVEDFD
jgi:hypothetical protein